MFEIDQNPLAGSAAEEMPLEMWTKMIDINLTAVFLCCKWEAKVMLSQGYGKIINTARYISKPEL